MARFLSHDTDSRLLPAAKKARSGDARWDRLEHGAATAMLHGDAEAGDGAKRKFKVKALRDGLAWSQRDWVAATEDTGVGNPQASTPEKGQRCLDGVAAQMADFLVELADADLDDLYE